ncbi:MAG: Exodeoxyribonuclease [Bacteroidetes bacterium ADurb.BinA245]|jgi:exodeoxyribonuclease-3|nr:MAG: Exodeoxyribonuclease [Bacteroidetes bacterium ADurb.BinA245]HNA96395.1 exodeoxyribonuclease III [Chitinophagaceae bacterium]HNJ54874.1 exodeoxyribonuclease III [Chitinophagaceae bacterium]HNK59859.1 exodeoxyribonuclease III [Chitinophagaceae bacterium]HNL58619.1 exodeoxyribonuclease III [Chitinophagaceae bacterium]
MRIISYNVNGIRAAIKKGFIDWLKTDPADIVCVQETKAVQDDVDAKLFDALGYHQYWFSAQKKGYSGVAVFSKVKPDNVVFGNGMKAGDDEGRVIQLDFKDIRLINAYFPSGTSGDERQGFKYEWLKELDKWLQKLKKKNPQLILCGDYNIAHEAIDIHDPKGNKNTSGFLPEERAWMTKFFESGWIDTFRVFHAEPHRYSWWSQRFPSVRLNNKGWRIDYINTTEALRSQLIDAEIYPDVKHSDHCPVYLELKN